jgi:hypothetical protein
MVQDNKGTQKAPFGNAAGGEQVEWLDGETRFVPEGTKVGIPETAPKKLPDWANLPDNGLD